MDVEIMKSIMTTRRSVICGDINAASTLWGATVANARGRQFEQIIDECDITVLNTGQGTYLKRDGTYSHLDVGMATSDIAIRCEWQVLEDDDWGSDHRPTQVTINENTVIEERNDNKLNMKKANWKSFKDICKAKLNNEIIKENELTYHSVTSVIQQAIEQAIPRSKAGGRKPRKLVPYWNDKCKTAIKNKRQARDKMSRTHDITDCIKFRECKARAQKVLREEQKAILERILWDAERREQDEGCVANE